MTSVWKRRLSYVLTMTSMRKSMRSAQGSSSDTSLPNESQEALLACASCLTEEKIAEEEEKKKRR